jgi:hypothetical protein
VNESEAWRKIAEGFDRRAAGEEPNGAVQTKYGLCDALFHLVSDVDDELEIQMKQRISTYKYQYTAGYFAWPYGYSAKPWHHANRAALAYLFAEETR